MISDASTSGIFLSLLRVMGLIAAGAYQKSNEIFKPKPQQRMHLSRRGGVPGENVVSIAKGFAFCGRGEKAGSGFNPIERKNQSNDCTDEPVMSFSSTKHAPTLLFWSTQGETQCRRSRPRSGESLSVKFLGTTPKKLPRFLGSLPTGRPHQILHILSFPGGKSLDEYLRSNRHGMGYFYGNNRICGNSVLGGSGFENRG